MARRRIAICKNEQNISSLASQAYQGSVYGSEGEGTRDLGIFVDQTSVQNLLIPAGESQTIDLSRIEEVSGLLLTHNGPLNIGLGLAPLDLSEVSKTTNYDWKSGEEEQVIYSRNHFAIFQGDGFLSVPEVVLDFYQQPNAYSKAEISWDFNVLPWEDFDQLEALRFGKGYSQYIKIWMVGLPKTLEDRCNVTLYWGRTEKVESKTFGGSQADALAFSFAKVFNANVDSTYAFATAENGIVTIQSRRCPACPALVDFALEEAGLTTGEEDKLTLKQKIAYKYPYVTGDGVIFAYDEDFRNEGNLMIEVQGQVGTTLGGAFPPGFLPPPGELTPPGFNLSSADTLASYLLDKGNLDVRFPEKRWEITDPDPVTTLTLDPRLLPDDPGNKVGFFTNIFKKVYQFCPYQCYGSAYPEFAGLFVALGIDRRETMENLWYRVRKDYGFLNPVRCSVPEHVLDYEGILFYHNDSQLDFASASLPVDNPKYNEDGGHSAWSQDYLDKGPAKAKAFVADNQPPDVFSKAKKINGIKVSNPGTTDVSLVLAVIGNRHFRLWTGEF